MHFRYFTAIMMIFVMVFMYTATACSASKREIIPLESIEQIDDNNFVCSFDGIEHKLLLYLPENSKGAPLVMMLHGYAESPSIMKRSTCFEEDAVPEGYAVCYVEGTSANSSYVKGWNSGIGINDNRDLEFLISLADHLERQYGLDTDRTFAVGFSNGAFMTYRLAVEASDIFEAVVSVAGMCPEMIWDEREDKITVGLFQISGQKDDVIPKHSDGTADSSLAPAIEDVIDYFASANDLSLISEEDIGKDSIITRYGGSRTGREVWHIFINGGRHSWPSESLTGIDINQLIIEFLDTQ